MSSRPEPVSAGVGEPHRPRWWLAITGPRARMIVIVVLAALNSVVIVIADAGDLSAARITLLGWQPPVPVSIAAAVLAPVLLLWRRRAPVLITVLTAVAYLLCSTLLPVGFALLTVAVQRRDLVLWACTAGVAATFWLTNGSGDPWFVDAGLAVVLASFWALWGSYVGARRALLQSLRDRARRAEDEQLARAEQARQTERARIAREMHDIVAHKVSLIALQAGGLEVNAQLSPERVAGTAAQIRTTAREALEDLRGVLGVLRAADSEGGPDAEPGGGELRPQPGLADIATLVERSRAAGLPVTLTMDPDVPAGGSADRDTPPGRSSGLRPGSGSPGLGSPHGGPFGGLDDGPAVSSSGRTAYRVVQEALTNVTKHARGATSTVTVQRQAGDPDGVGSGGPVLVVSVVNRRPVAAGSLLPGSGAGLIGLRERVELIGGRLSAGPTTDGGWQVRAVLPLAASGSSSSDGTGAAPGSDGADRLGSSAGADGEQVGVPAGHRATRRSRRVGAERPAGGTV